jgi:hypothetical protein
MRYKSRYITERGRGVHVKQNITYRLRTICQKENTSAGIRAEWFYDAIAPSCSYVLQSAPLHNRWFPQKWIIFALFTVEFHVKMGK